MSGTSTRESQAVRYWLTPKGWDAATRAQQQLSRPEGSGNPGVTGAQPDEPASQAGRPAQGEA